MQAGRRTRSPSSCRGRCPLRSRTTIRWLNGFAAALVALTVIAAPAVPYTRGLLFRIDAPGRPPSWVYGTLHSSDPRVLAVPAVVTAAMAGSRRLAPEMLLAPGDLPEFVAGAQLEDGHKLADYFDAPTRERIRRALGADAPSAAALEGLKPWAVLLLLAQPGAAQRGATLDEVLVDEARRHRLTVIGLELPDEQVASLDTIPLASQVALVRWTLDRRDQLAADNEKAIAAWLERDLAELAALSRAPGIADPAMAPHFAQLTKHIVVNRSVLMAHRLFLPLREGRVFVAVGALHLYGSQGLLALIEAQGYRITRVY